MNKAIVTVPSGLPTNVLVKAGRFTLWSLSGSVDIQTFALAWIDAGLDAELLPNGPSETVALQRACRDAEGRRSVRARLKDGGWALATLRDTNDLDGADVQINTELRIWLRDGALRFTPHNHTLVDEIRKSFNRHMMLLSPNDISCWLVRMASKLNAVSLRDHGGVYFVPNQAVPAWAATTTTLTQNSSHRVYNVPAVEGDTDTIALIADAVAAEVTEQREKIAYEIASGTLGVRALEERKRRLGDLEVKLITYETVLGSSLGKLRDELKEVDADVGLAMLSAAAAEEGAA